jgi:integrase
MALTVKRVQKLLRAGVPGRHTDGVQGGGVRGLMLDVESKTSAAWVLRYQRAHAKHWMGLGSAFDLSLAAAREHARRERERLLSGVDPLALRKADREAQRQAEAKRLTFKEAAERCHEALSVGWSSPLHANEFIGSLRRWAYPYIGGIDVAAIGKDEVLRVLEQKLPAKMGKGAGNGTFWTGRTQTADRTRNRIERVLDWAEARGFRPSGTPNPARWKGFLDQLLAKPRRIAPLRNMPSVPYDEVPALMQALAAEESVASAALRFLIMTSARLGSVLGATWEEIDLKAAQWVIPKERMKARKEHTVPLSPQVVALLHGLYREEGNPYLFVSTKPGTQTHIAETTVTDALRRAGRKETLHGFRASFKTWAEERTNFPSIIAELSLAHTVGNAVERAYRRTDLATKRRKLMEQWSRFVTSPPVAGTVVPMQGKRRQPA